MSNTKRNLLVAVLAVPAFAAATPTVSGITAKPNSLFYTDTKHDIFVNNGWTSGSTTFGASSFQQWHNGSLTNNKGTYGWNSTIGTETGGAMSGNPDRGDSASFYAGQSTQVSTKGTLKEVFEGGANGKKNLNWIIDGEDGQSYSMDLMYGNGKYIKAANAPQLMLLERGGNSKIRVYGLDQLGHASANFIDLNTFSSYSSNSVNTKAGFAIDTQEIGGAQDVYGLGLNVSSLGMNNIYGFRFVAQNSFNGPDIVGIASTQAVPEPASMAALALGTLGLIRRRKSATK